MGHGGKDSNGFRAWTKTGKSRLSTSTEALAKGLGLLPPDRVHEKPRHAVLPALGRHARAVLRKAPVQELERIPRLLHLIERIHQTNQEGERRAV